MQEIYQELADVTAKGEKAVLATVVSSRGSAPRKTGTQFLAYCGEGYADDGRP